MVSWCRSGILWNPELPRYNALQENDSHPLPLPPLHLQPHANRKLFCIHRMTWKDNLSWRFNSSLCKNGICFSKAWSASSSAIGRLPSQSSRKQYRRYMLWWIPVKEWPIQIILVQFVSVSGRRGSIQLPCAVLHGIKAVWACVCRFAKMHWPEPERHKGILQIR